MIRKYFPTVLNWFLPGFKIAPLIYSSLHALWMMLFCLLWLTHINICDGFDFMKKVIDYRDLITKNIFDIRRATDINKKYLVINTSKNNQLLAGDNDNQINSVVVDRKKLCRVLNILDSNSYKICYVICDIFFEDKDGVNDNNLQDVITRLNHKNKIILPYSIGDGKENYISFPFINANFGLSQYRSSFLNTQYLKFTYIINDTIKQLPLKAYEDITGKEMKQRDFFGVKYYMIDSKWCLNTVIPEFRYTSDDLIPDETYYELGFFTADFIKNNQIVIIGDFEGIRDRHHSIINKVAGAMIILNAFEALEQGDNLIGISYLVILFLFFLVISYHTLYKGLTQRYWGKRKKPNMIIDFLHKWINYLLILMISIVSMLFFHHYFHLFIILGYFSFIEILFCLLNKGGKSKRTIE